MASQSTHSGLNLKVEQICLGIGSGLCATSKLVREVRFTFINTICIFTYQSLLNFREGSKCCTGPVEAVLNAIAMLLPRIAAAA